MKLSKLASAMPFAHFLGHPAAAARAESDDDRKQRDDETDEDYAKRMEEKDKEEEAARKAEEDKQKEDARRAEGDDDADAEADDKDDKEEGRRAARQRERVRCAAIVAEGIKLGSVKQACSLAFDTKMTAAQAIGVLKTAAADRSESNASAVAAPAPRRGPSIDERMAKVVTPNPGASTPAAAAPSLAEQILAAGKLRRGEA
jgi:hypothetical protein